MVSPGQSLAFDFSSAINLLHSLSSPQHAPRPADFSSDLGEDFDGRPHTLGNFDKLWRFLGQPLDAPPPNPDTLPDQENQYHYLVNGEQVGVLATSNKGVRWRDEVNGADLEDNDDFEQLSPLLSKKEKKAAKRLAARKQKKEAAKKRGGSTGQITASDVNTDAESSADDSRRLQHSPADRRLTTHNRLYGSPNKPATPPAPSSSIRGPTITHFHKRSYSDSKLFDWQAPARGGVSTQPRIQPLVPVSEAQQKANLIAHLMKEFPREHNLLLNTDLANPRVAALDFVPLGIHVFVDVSNILIGFHNAIKLSRNVPHTNRIRRIPLSFHNLSLILERGRPASKRVLVGSNLFPSIAEAKALGYETNILSRVHKAKELTARQKKYLSGTSSGSETASKFFAQEKWVEQGVDEILHLKILESLLDSPAPTTIVLATGDAAEAEYSDGFLRMVERALERGWAIELVSFRMNTSSAYRNRKFRDKWGKSFSMVTLDLFLEELFGYGE